MSSIILFDWDTVIPAGLLDNYSSPQALINALNAIDVNLVPQMYDFTMSISRKSNLRGSLRIGWNCQAKNVVFSGRNNLILLMRVLNALNHKAKVMLLVATVYQDQKSKVIRSNKRYGFQFVFQNLALFNQYWNT